MNKLLEAKKIANSISTGDSRSTILNKVVKTYNAVMQACDKKSEGLNDWAATLANDTQIKLAIARANPVQVKNFFKSESVDLDTVLTRVQFAVELNNNVLYHVVHLVSSYVVWGLKDGTAQHRKLLKLAVKKDAAALMDKYYKAACDL